MYEYTFDKTTVGNYKVPRPDYQLIQEALKLLLSKLQEWNLLAFNRGAVEVPYNREFEDLQQMINFGEEQLDIKPSREIVLQGVSVGSLRYLKAAMIYAAQLRENEISELAVKEQWPSVVVESTLSKVRKFHKLAKGIDFEPAAILNELQPETASLPKAERGNPTWDVFISHASEDKDSFVRMLAAALQAEGIKVWYDDFTLRLGDSLRKSIDRGLARSKFGVVILSHSFFNKEWPQRELDGLAAQEVNGRKVILPVWHNITVDDIRKYSPTIADRIAVSSSIGVDKVVECIVSAIS